jgi:hypothetical protein
MTQQVILRARAYVYTGDWVADCPRPGCSNVEHLFEPVQPRGPRIRQKSLFICSHCGEQAVIDWPSQDFMFAVMEILVKRPVPSNRNWYPADHETAVRFRIEHGQSLDDLRAENEEHGVTP